VSSDEHDREGPVGVVRREVREALARVRDRRARGTRMAFDGDRRTYITVVGPLVLGFILGVDLLLENACGRKLLGPP
jgi:hypothetical protein